MITEDMVNVTHNLHELCASHANHNGYVCATEGAFQIMFPGESVGSPQSFEYQGTMITVATSTAGVPPNAWT